jgi:hypothetical protein
MSESLENIRKEAETLISQMKSAVVSSEDYKKNL